MLFRSVSKPIPLLDFVEQQFVEDKENRSIKGKSSFVYEIFGRNLSDLCVFLEPDGFKTNVIHNILENIHKYAFPETLPAASKKKRLVFFKAVFHGKPTYMDIEERKVQISLKVTSDNLNMATLIIENNGIPFEGDTESVFNYGYHTGKGSGIGMFSASKFLNDCGGNISIESTPNSEYTVRFIIKLPIYGKV